MGLDKNRARAREIIDGVMSGRAELIDGPHLDCMSKKLIGSVGEELAARYLQCRGYEIVERNYRCPEGEADIVAFDEGAEEVVLVEVKARRSHSGELYPEEAVTPSKQKRYRRIALQFAAEHYPCPAIRFDVIAVTLLESGVGEVKHLYGAFDWEAR